MASKSYDINIIEKDYTPFQELNLEFSGNDINKVLINTLRRVILLDNPTYAFHNLQVKKNTSIFNNDYLKMRLLNIPVQKIKNNEVNNYLNIINNNINTDKLEKLTLYIDVKNNTNEKLNVTTADATFYNESEQIESIYKYPILLIKLKPTEEIKLSININLDIGHTHIKYSPVSICAFEEVTPTKFNFSIEANKQLNEYKILSNSCKIIQIKLNKILDVINEMPSNNNDTEGYIELKNENHTMANLITYYLQSSKYILFAGYKMDHLLINNSTIRYKLTGEKTINQVLVLVINQIISIYSYIGNKFNK